MTKLYDVRRRLNLGTSRFTYVIDKSGTIRFVGHNEMSMGPPIRDALRVLDETGATAHA